MAIQAETAIPEVVVAAIDSVGTITSGTINYVVKLGSVGSTIDVNLAKGADNITIGDINDITGTITALSGLTHTSTFPVSFVDTTSTVQAQQATSPWTVETTTSTIQVEQVTSPWTVRADSASTAHVVQYTSPWITRGDSSSTANVVQATSPWTVETTTSTIQVEQVTSPWTVQTTTSTIPEVTSIGSTVDTNIATASVMVPTDAQSVYQSAVTLWESTNAEATTNTSAAVDISTFITKTVCIHCTQASTLVIQTTPTSSTATWYDYYTDDNVSANTYTTKSFTEAQYWCRVQVTPSGASTLSAWVVRQVG